jgi:putative intracellular protease/amidase
VGTAIAMQERCRLCVPRASCIPGGGGTWPLLDEKNHASEVQALLEWVHAMDDRVKIMASVCTGAAVLARAGFARWPPDRHQSRRAQLGRRTRSEGALG